MPLFGPVSRKDLIVYLRRLDTQARSLERSTNS